EQWLDVKYGNHETMDKNIKDGVISTWLIRSYKQQFNDYVEINRKNDVFEHNADMECDPSNVEADDEEVLTDKELSNPEELYVNEDDETAKIGFKLTYSTLKHLYARNLMSSIIFLSGHVECPLVVKRTMDIVMGETYLELFEIKAWCTFKIMNGIRHLRMEKNKVETIRDEKEPMDDYDTGNLDDHLISNNEPYYEEEEQYKEKRFVAIKECGHDDWMRTKEDAFHAYRDIFTKMDKGWFVTRME
ncbi:hypothetical protein Tco_0964350, partial [Tanacetum coccineum]